MATPAPATKTPAKPKTKPLKIGTKVRWVAVNTAPKGKNREITSVREGQLTVLAA